MNFQQLRIIRETVRQNFNLTEAANALFTSQSGVSKHIKDLEDELGIELFVRRGKRLTGLTEPGKELAEIVERMLMDARNIKRLAEQFSNKDEGRLHIATTHTQARYVLPHIVARFKQEFPRVHLVLHQASPGEIVTLLNRGDADVGIATESLEGVPSLASFPYHSWHHSIIVPDGHPLTKEEKPTLEQIGDYPIITYHEGYTGRASIDRTFAEAGVVPDVVMAALDADVIKSYVELGLGIGIIASVAFNAQKDAGLKLISGEHLFPQNTTRIAVRRGHYLRGYAFRFIEYCSAELQEPLIKAAMVPGKDLEID